MIEALQIFAQKLAISLISIILAVGSFVLPNPRNTEKTTIVKENETVIEDKLEQKNEKQESLIDTKAKQPTLQTAPLEEKTETIIKTPPITETVETKIPPPPLPSIQEIISAITSIPVSANAVNEKVRGALVNILCSTKSGGPLKPITGSGIIIDNRGVILTNAHVAQYFLLKDFQTKNFVECIIRTGSPAYPKYKADLLFISPKWVKDNYKSITSNNPLGTGENDFALLLIKEPVGTNTLPENFPYINFETEDKAIEALKDTSHVIAGYPAGFLGGISIVKELYPVSTISSIKQVLTFKETSIDVISMGGTIVSQKGSSGGAVVNQYTEKLVGIIVTTSSGETTDERDLHAVTTSHINRSISESAGSNLKNFLDGDLKLKSENFLANSAPELTSILTNAILGN